MRLLLTNRKFIISVILAFLLVIPTFIQDSYLRHCLIVAFIYAVIASNWDLSFGYAGVFNMGHLAFFGLGVYTCALLSKIVGLSPWLGIFLSGLIAFIAGAIICLPILRLREFYVVLVSFSFSELLLRFIMSQERITGGAKGIVLIPALTLGDYSFLQDGKLAYYYTALLLLIMSTCFLRYLVGSRFGLSIIALRDNEDYGISRGISLARQRLLTLAGSAIFTGFAGGFYATYLRVASPEIFGFDFLSLILSMLLLGGLSSIYGPILAAFVLTFMTEAMINLGPWRFMISAIVTIIVILFYHGGLISALQKGYDRLTVLEKI